jgi:hypothetical protein
MLRFLDDDFLLYGLQAVLVLVFCYSLLRERGWFTRPTGASATNVRGNVSWESLNIAFGLVGVNVLQIVTGASDSVRFKVAMGFTDLAILIYLFFFSSWFRNKVIGWISSSRTKEEGALAVSRAPTPGNKAND